MKNLFVLFLIGICFFQCASDKAENEKDEIVEELDVNPAAEEFDKMNSDVKAIEVADAVMESMGGRKAWDETKIISWNFFGARKLWWNKHTGDVRIEFPENDSNVLITNIYTHQGKVKIDGKEVLEPDSLVNYYTEMAESIWINDSYWLFMPFKLKDSKVTLKYEDIDTIQDGRYCHQLRLTFTDIGDTPQNMYLVSVDTISNMVCQWSYFDSSSDSLPKMTTPWDDYQKYGDLLLSSGRGKNNITEITVLDSIAESVFTTF